MYEEREWAAFIKWLQQSHYGVWLCREETPTSNPLMRHMVLSTGRWPSLRSWRITALRELCSCKFNVLILEGSVFWQETLHQSSTCERGLAVEQGAKNEPFLHHFPIKMRRHPVPLAQDYRTVQHWGWQRPAVLCRAGFAPVTVVFPHS